MKFGWINVFGAGIVMLMLIPNIIYAFKNKEQKNLCKNRVMNALEQIGRYGCIVLMWLPLFTGKFGFAGVIYMFIYITADLLLISVYWAIFALYFKKKTACGAIALAAIPALIFLLSGILLCHWPLVVSSAVFAAGHIYVTVKNTPQPAVPAGK